MTIALRNATAADAENLLLWVNDPESLINKRLTQTTIPREQHQAWLQTALTDPDIYLWIVESDALPVGQIRLTRQQGAYEVDIFVTGSHRRHGYALAALRVALLELQATKPGMPVLARIMHHNTTSIRLFERAGFTAIDHGDDQSDHLIFRHRQGSAT